jgi:hypothetical protein
MPTSAEIALMLVASNWKTISAKMSHSEPVISRIHQSPASARASSSSRAVAVGAMSIEPSWFG